MWLTPEIRALCTASCSRVCPKQHGQCSFCCPPVILSKSVVHQIIWLWCRSLIIPSLGMGQCSLVLSLFSSRLSKQLRMESKPGWSRWWAEKHSAQSVRPTWDPSWIFSLGRVLEGFSLKMITNTRPSDLVPSLNAVIPVEVFHVLNNARHHTPHSVSR